MEGICNPRLLCCALALEGKQLVSVVLVLLAACRDFGRETRLEGSGQGLEAVKYGDDAMLFFQRWNWKLQLFEFIHIYRSKTRDIYILLTPFINDEHIMEHKLYQQSV